ncbi:MAG: hypothetical protein JXR49_04760 [Acidobacteria bacterium]|nr:hypothetical protein [Acidobacteriota bacterium]
MFYSLSDFILIELIDPRIVVLVLATGGIHAVRNQGISSFVFMGRVPSSGGYRLPFHVIKTLLPHQPGSSKYLALYGDALVAVRYRYNEKDRKRRITVELVVDERDWEKSTKRKPPNRIVKVRIRFGETSLGLAARSVGGRWNQKLQVWEMRYCDAVTLGLEKRIVG